MDVLVPGGLCCDQEVAPSSGHPGIEAVTPVPGFIEMVQPLASIESQKAGQHYRKTPALLIRLGLHMVSDTGTQADAKRVGSYLRQRRLKRKRNLWEEASRRGLTHTQLLRMEQGLQNPILPAGTRVTLGGISPGKGFVITNTTSSSMVLFDDFDYPQAFFWWELTPAQDSAVITAYTNHAFPELGDKQGDKPVIRMVEVIQRITDDEVWVEVAGLCQKVLLKHLYSEPRFYPGVLFVMPDDSAIVD